MECDHPLRSYRKKQRLTQAALAVQLGVSRVTIARWENGDREIERKRWKDVAERTGIPIAEIAGLNRMEAAQ